MLTGNVAEQVADLLEDAELATIGGDWCEVDRLLGEAQELLTNEGQKLLDLANRIKYRIRDKQFDLS